MYTKYRHNNQVRMIFKSYQIRCFEINSSLSIERESYHRRLGEGRMKSEGHNICGKFFDKLPKKVVLPEIKYEPPS